jgi:hyperosmotically inducible protein
MEMNLRDMRWSRVMRTGFGQGAALLALCVYVLLIGHLAYPMLAQSAADQSKTSDSTSPPTKPQKDPHPVEPPAQESKPAQPDRQTFKSDKPKTEKEMGEEEAEKEKEVTGRKTVSSLILTVKLALLGDPRLFPYEIEVESASDEVTLLGKVSTDAEKAAAAEIASMVPSVKSVVNKLEMVKELSEGIAHKQDDIITRHVKEQFAKSVTVTSAKFDVKTEQGVVSLSGTVRFQVIVLEAVEAARQVPGVKAVKTDKVKIESDG